MFEIHCRNQLTVNVKTDPGIQRTAALAYRHHHLSLVSGICLKVIIGWGLVQYCLPKPPSLLVIIALSSSLRNMFIPKSSRSVWILGCNHRVCVDTFKNQGDKILRLFRILNCWFIVVVATNFTSLAFSHSVRDTHCTLPLTPTFYAAHQTKMSKTLLRLAVRRVEEGSKNVERDRLMC